jgi:putative protease
MSEIEVGKVSDYFAKIGVVAIKITAEGVRVGDRIRFSGHTTNFSQEIESLQIEHESVQEAAVGSEVGMKVSERVRTHDTVYKIVE